MTHDLAIFMDGIAKWFGDHPRLSRGVAPTIHSVRSRLKDREHLLSKLHRKFEKEPKLTDNEVFDSVTDLAGVRVLHIHQAQFAEIHREIQGKIEAADWFLFEDPKAYTWDPDARQYFSEFGLKVEVKESAYTSVHYVVKPKQQSGLFCEIQVRTLFEEIWGEVDHRLNYPTPSPSISCKEQIRVLSKLVGAGSRLVDSIFRVSEEESGVKDGKS